MSHPWWALLEWVFSSCSVFGLVVDWHSGQQYKRLKIFSLNVELHNLYVDGTMSSAKFL